MIYTESDRKCKIPLAEGSSGRVKAVEENGRSEKQKLDSKIFKKEDVACLFRRSIFVLEDVIKVKKKNSRKRPKHFYNYLPRGKSHAVRSLMFASE